MPSLNLNFSANNQHGLRNLITWIAVGIPLLMVTVMLLGWFMAGYANATSRLTTGSALAADEISEFIHLNPDFWQFDEQHLTQVISNHIKHGGVQRVRIVNTDGQQVLLIGPDLQWPAIMRSTALSDGSNRVGRIEFWCSLSGLVNDSMFAGIVGIPLALLVFIALRLVPLRALDRAMSKLEESEQALTGRVNELQEATGRLRKQRRELKGYAESATEARDVAEAANRSKSEFLANMSHELRTPLNAVIGFSDMMRNELLGPVGNPQYLSYAKDIHNSGEHLLGLINDILDISKIESGAMELYDEPLDIALIVRSSLTLVKTRAQVGGISLENQALGPLPVLNADARKIKQVVINLLSNAVKFTRRNGTVTITAAVEDDGRFSIRVSDTGIGIAPEDIERVLKPFIQADSSLDRKYEGTGLGLPLTKALIELHQGVLELSSKQGVGTTAAVFFPARRVAIQEADTLHHLNGAA